MLAEWNDLFNDIKNTVLVDKRDTVCWDFDTKGIYTVKSFYNIINFRGVSPGNSISIWNIKVPLRIHIFLWLVSNNKLLTRDNLQKRQTVDNASCLFCSDPENVDHLFFGCVVAIELWRVIFDISNKHLGMSIDDMLEWWSDNKNHPADCLLHSAVLWTLWKYRNDICFNHVV